ncbi:hypothetical protein SOVF_020210 [Spinacia oleracea]|nr:hypothetical protein SOVF_020210 [Spinacia oleracea]
MITFQMYNETHTWTVAKFNEVLGLPTTGPRLTPKHWSAVPLWRILTGENDYDSKESSITSVRHPALRYILKVFASTIFGRKEWGKVRKAELYMLYHMLHAQPIDAGAFLVRQMQTLANTTTGGGVFVQGGLITPIALYLGHASLLKRDGAIDGGLITPIALYLGHASLLKRDGAIDGQDAVDVPSSWLKKKEGTTIWCIKNVEDELPPQEKMSLRHAANWSFDDTQPRVRVPILPEPPVIPSTTEGASSSSSSIERALAKLQGSVDTIMQEQCTIKEDISSMFAILENLNTWMKSQGFPNPSLAPPR